MPYVIVNVKDLRFPNKIGRRKIHKVKLDSNFWRQKKSLEIKYKDQIKVHSTLYRVDLAAHIEPCKKLNHFLRKFNFQLQYSII